MLTRTQADRLSVLMLDRGNASGRRFSLVLHGGSMLPFFKDGQKLTVDCGEGEPNRVGDVIVFERTGRLCAHRVVARFQRGGEPWYVEKGDNQLEWSRVPQREVLGKVVAADGCRLALTGGVLAGAAACFYAKWSYALAVIAALPQSAPLRLERPAFSWPQRLVRSLCLRAAKGMLRLLLFAFPARQPERL